MNLTTTLAKIKAANPCQHRWKAGLRKAGGLRKYGADTPITVRQILDAMGLDDALWCLRTMPEHDSRWRLLAVRYARRVQNLMTDPRSLAALDVAERHARGLATDEELDAARGAAWAAADEVADEVVAEAAAWATAAEAAATWAARRADSEHAARERQAQELIRICDEEL